MGPDIDIVDQKQIDPAGAEPQQRLLNRAHCPVVGIIDDGAVRLSADKARPGLREVKWIHPAASLGAEDHVLPPYSPERSSAAVLGQTVAVMRRCIDQVDAEFEGAACGGNRRLIVELKEEIAQRRSSEPEDGDLKFGPAKPAPRQCGLRNHGESLLFPAPLRRAGLIVGTCSVCLRHRRAKPFC